MYFELLQRPCSLSAHNPSQDITTTKLKGQVVNELVFNHSTTQCANYFIPTLIRKMLRYLFRAARF